MNAFIHPRRSQRIRIQLWLALIISLTLAHVPLVENISTAYAEEVDVGYRDITYPSGVGANSEVTAEKPESKLWWNDGSWWASMWSTTGNAYHIYRLEWNTQTWTDTGVELDDRKDSKADVLWDASSNKLYVASHLWSGSGETVSAGDRGELFRYSYSGGAYTLDAGFPVEVNDANSEALVIAKDSTGTLWVTYVADEKVMVNHSIGGDDTDWGTPYVLPSSGATSSDDLSTIVAYNGRVGIMWSSQSSSARMYFAVHTDGAGDAETDWKIVDVYNPSGDDHINIKSLQSDAAGNVFAVIKTSKSAALIVLLVCKGDCTVLSNWSADTVYKGGSGSPTRPIMLIDTSNRDLYFFARIKYDGSKSGIYYKMTDMDNIQFDPDALGTPFIQSSTETGINDPTSTKQNVNSSTGLVVMASDASERYYLHNCLPLTGAAGACSNQTLLPSVSFDSATYTAGEEAGTATIQVALSATATDPITVAYTTGDGTATALAPTADYTAASGTLTFAPGETSQSFTVPVLDDALDEADETVTLTLSNPSGAALGTPANATLTILDNDEPPTVQFSQADYSADEAAGTAPIGVSLSAASGRPVTVTYSTDDATATAGADYTATGGTLTFAPGQTSQSFTVPVLDDALDEADETVALTLSTPGNATLGTPSSASLTLLDNDAPPTVQLEKALYSAAEDAGSVTIAATLSTPSGLPVSVTYAIQDGTTTVDADYSATGGTLTFAPGETSQSFTISLLDDALDESDETLTIALSAPVSATLGTPASASLTLFDNDEPPTVHFSTADYTAGESAGVAPITVQLSAPSGLPVSVAYAATDGTASAGADYSAIAGTLTFAPGQTSQGFDVSVLDDTADEADETVALALSSPTNATLDTPVAATLTLLDNDSGSGTPSVQFSSATYHAAEGAGTATIQVTLSTAVTAPVTVDYSTADGSATADDYGATSGTLTFAPGQTGQSISVTITDDSLAEDDETVLLTLHNPDNATLGTPTAATLTLLDDDTPSTLPRVLLGAAAYSAVETTDALTVEVLLSAAATTPVSVNYATSNGTATAGADYTATSGTLTFAPGQTQHTLSIPLLDDSLGESDEQFSLALRQPNGAVLGLPASATLTLLDDETQPTVQFSSATYTVPEGVGSATISVSLNRQADTPVTVQYATSNGTATDGADYTATSGTLTFAPGETAHSFTLPVLNDTLDEADETVRLTLHTPTGARGGVPVSATLTLLDDETPPTVQFSATTYRVAEKTGLATIPVQLSAASGLTVTVGYRTDGGSASADDYTAANGTLTFAPGQTSQSFTIAITDDGPGDAEETILLTLTGPTNAVAGASTTATLIISEDRTNALQLYLPLIQHSE